MYRIFYCSMFLFLISFYSCTDTDIIDSKEPNNTNLGKVQLTIDKSTKVKTLTLINFSSDWKLYAGNDPNNIDKTQSILEGNGNGTYTIKSDNSNRSYFELVSSGKNISFAENHLPIEGGYNFRDLGGIKTSNNKTINWGKIIRSGDMNKLTDNDLKYLSSIPLTSIVDFRTADEINVAPDKTPQSVTNNFKLSISPGNLFNTGNLSKYTSNELDSIMMQMNILFVTDEAIIKNYKEFFTLLQNEKNLPLLYHCSAGKDRAGMATALLLYALGVDDETIMDNYLASNTYLADKYSKYINLYPSLKSLYTVKKEFLGAGITRIKSDYGTVEKYLEQVLDVDIQKIRKIFLE